MKRYEDLAVATAICVLALCFVCLFSGGRETNAEAGLTPINDGPPVHFVVKLHRKVIPTVNPVTGHGRETIEVFEWDIEYDYGVDPRRVVNLNRELTEVFGGERHNALHSERVEVLGRDKESDSETQVQPCKAPPGI